MMVTDDMKICPKCKEEKATSEFSRNIRRSDGLQFACKACTSKAVSASQRKYKDRVNATNRLWKKKHHSIVQERNAAYRKDNPRIAIWNHNRKSARIAGGSKFTLDEWNALMESYNGCCAYCGTDKKKMTVDHVVPLSRGGSNAIDNIAPACGTCNSSKGTKLLSEWMTNL